MNLASFSVQSDHELLTRFLTGLCAKSNIPLRIALWNGSRHDLGADPRVTVSLPGPAALRYFLFPSLDNLAEGYIDSHFDVLGRSQDIVAVATLLAQSSVPLRGRFARTFNPVFHNRAMDKRAIAHHYDVSNDFYAQWLDPQMVYSCAYFEGHGLALEQAQLAKMDHILQKILLKPGERLLDIGCGWGALVIRAALKFGARAVGITLSQSQYDLARQRVAEAGLTEQVEIRLMDYRDLNPCDDQFDKITSVGMFEHVGLHHLRDYFSKINGLLREGGLVLNHGITTTDPGNGAAPLGAANFIDKYVFPNGELPHISLVLKDMQSAGLEALDVECMRRHYEKTLQAWTQNFEDRSHALRGMVDEKTFRVWRIYLAGCAHAFAQNWVSLYQVLACKAGVDDRLNPTPWTRAYMYNGVKDREGEGA